MRRARAALLFVAVLAGVAARARAADTFEMRAWVEPRATVAEGDPVRLVIQVTGSRAEDVSVPQLPPMKNLRVASGPSTSRNTSFSFDGTSARMSSSVTLMYVLLPMGPGPAEIPSIDVRVGSATAHTEPIRLDVRAGGRAAPPPRGGAPPSSGEAPAETSAGPSDDVFLGLQVTPKEVWEGEPLFLEVALYARVAIAGFEWAERPSLQGFWSEAVDVDPNQERRRENRGGKDYLVYPVLRYMLVPTRSGDLTVGSFKAQLQARRAPRDFFSDFFGQGGVETVLRRTDPVRIKVKPLPEAGRPAGFGGAVGSFRLAVTADRKTAGVNDAVAVKATVEGTGSLQSVPAPALDPGPGFKLYDPKVTESTSLDGGRMRSRRTWEWVLVPLVPGDQRIPEVRFPYFDPAAGTYREARSEALPLRVERGSTEAGTMVARGEVREQRREIRYIKLGGGALDDRGEPIYRRPVFTVLAVLPLALGPALVVLGRRRARLMGDEGLMRARGALRRARRRLDAARRSLDRSPAAGFHEDVARALVEFVADRFRRAPAGLTYDIAEDLLASRGVAAEARARYRRTLEACDFARFVPESGERGRREEILREAREMVEALARVL